MNLFPLIKTWLAVAAIGLICAGFMRGAEADAELRALLAKIPTTAEGDLGISPAKATLAKQIQAHGAATIPYLLPLLEHDEVRVRQFAGYVLRDTAGLTEAHLDALIAARLRGDEWIPPTIGRIGTPRALAFLVEELRKEPEAESQLGFAFEQAGKRGAVALAEVFKDRTPVDPKLASAIFGIYRNMGEKAVDAIDPLLEIAAGKSYEPKNRIHAVQALGGIGKNAQKAVPSLTRLAANEPDLFANSVKGTLIGIGAPEAVPVFLERLKAEPDMLVFRDLSEIRENGRAAGSEVVKFLGHEAWDLRVGAARCLGYIGYTEGTQALIDVLADPNDWRLVYVAAESLGRLHAKTAIPALERVASRYWYPPVAAGAQKAIRVINDEEAYPSRWPQRNFAFDFFNYEHVATEDTPSGEAIYIVKRQNDELDAASLARMSYPVEIIGYGTEGKVVNKRTTKPSCGLKVPNGFLLGSNRGEWGGELIFTDGASAAIRVIEDNVRGIHHLPFGIVAITGLAHITLNHGMIYLVEVPASGKPKATKWKSLPGAPRQSGIMSDGRLFVSCYGGDIVVSVDGRISMAETTLPTTKR